MTRLNELTLKEVQAVAKDLNITLSYKAENSTRKRYTKAELIALIEKAQVEQTQTKRTVVTNLIEAQAPTVKPIVISGENIKLVRKQEQQQKLNLNTVVKQARELLAVGKVEKVHGYIKELNNNISNEKRNKLLVAKMSQLVNVLKGMLKQHSKKVLTHA